MKMFMETHAALIQGALSGFDRILFRGTLRSISYQKGIEIFATSQHVLFKNFKPWSQSLSARLRDHARDFAARHQRPYLHIDSPDDSKEEIATRIAQKDGIQEGLVCVLGCTQVCQTVDVKKNHATGMLELPTARRQCLYVYFYFLDRTFGLLHVRLQTWLPFTIHVCLNGREYLARQLDRHHIGYEKKDNCFTRIDDLLKAQALLQQLEQRNWTGFLKTLARRVNPLLATFGASLRPYYWSFEESEYATDIMFKDRQSLDKIFPYLTGHALKNFGSEDVLRFLGRRTNTRSNGEVKTVFEKRLEGVRLKHWAEENSLKMYNKQGSVLRIEMTMNQAKRFKVWRLGTKKGRCCMLWLRLRKSVRDIARRVDICRAANERYLEALAVASLPQPVQTLLDPVSQRVVRKGRPYRGLRPITEQEGAAFRIMLNGAFLIQGFRNRDVREHLIPEIHQLPEADQRKASGRVSRLLRLYRAHALIRKVSATRYYRVTLKGHQVMTTALKLRQTDLQFLAA